jgi:predicted transcriptional regulator
LGIDEQGELWNVLPDSVKETIKESLKQSEAGKVLSNEEVMNDIKSRFIKE